MRFQLVIAGAFAALASAQATTASAAAPQTSAQAAIVACINACRLGDVDCTAHCIAVPSPNTDQVIKTNECVAACPKGNGTEADNLSYKNCVDGCVAKYYYASNGTPNPTGGSGSGSGNGNGNGAGATTGTGTTNPTASRSGSGSQTSSTASTTPNAAPALAGSSAFGIVGFLAALLAL